MPDNKWVADLKTLLQVAKARLDVREKKKTEQAAKERYAIVDHVRNNKAPRARIGKYNLIITNIFIIDFFQPLNISFVKIIKSKQWIESKHTLIHF